MEAAILKADPFLTRAGRFPTADRGAEANLHFQWKSEVGQKLVSISNGIWTPTSLYFFKIYTSSPAPQPGSICVCVSLSLSLSKEDSVFVSGLGRRRGSSSSSLELLWRLCPTPPLTFWRRRLGKNDLYRKRVGRHSNFPTVAEAESGKLIFASATSNAHPYTTLIEGNVKGEERLQLQNYLKIIMDSNIIPNMLLTPIMESRNTSKSNTKRRRKKLRS